MTRFSIVLVIALSLGALLAPAGAAALEIKPSFPQCLPADWSGLVTAAGPAADWQAVRVYFRAVGSEDWYFMEMEEGADGFWAVLPWPEASTQQVEMYLLTVDGAGEKAVSPTASGPVVSGCDVALTPEQAKRAENMVVGETVESQRGDTVLGFECQGIISRIWSDGTVHQDTACREVLMAAATPTGSTRTLGAMVLGAVVGGGVVLALDEEQDCSCVCPPCDCTDCAVTP